LPTRGCPVWPWTRHGNWSTTLTGWKASSPRSRPPEYASESCSAITPVILAPSSSTPTPGIKAAFHDTDILARIVARMSVSVSVSMSVSWNASPENVQLTLDFWTKAARLSSCYRSVAAWFVVSSYKILPARCGKRKNSNSVMIAWYSHYTPRNATRSVSGGVNWLLLAVAGGRPAVFPRVK